MLRPVHFEIPSVDPEKAITFWSSVFGWQFHKYEGGGWDYWLVKTGADGPGIDGGLLNKMDDSHTVVNTLDVPSVDDYAGKVQAAGGTIVVPKMAIPGIGWLVYFKDLDGNIHGMMQNDPGAK